MKIVIAGGGTGGHLFPAIAVARELERSMRDVHCTFVGTVRGIESKIIPREGYDILGEKGKSEFYDDNECDHK